MYCRCCARAKDGQRAPHPCTADRTAGNHPDPAGLQAAMTVSGAVNGNGFAAYLDQVLGPTPAPGDVVVLDHLPAHKVAGLTESVEARGARLRYLPPHSPDFNLIEPAFSKLRT